MPTAVGCRFLEPWDEAQGTAIPMALFYPAKGDEQPQEVGPYTISLAKDAEPEGADLPLVVLSHGNGGSPWTLRDLARHLARNGFAVALPEHMGNTRRDNSLAGTAANLANRPRHITVAIDAATGDEIAGASITADRAGVAGHSFGGYTGLAAAGGKPMTGREESAGGPPMPVEVTPDGRLKALVLMAPATPWLAHPGALDDVHLPILMRTGERDDITPSWHADNVLKGVPDPSRVHHREIPGAGHFSFMSQYPPPMVGPHFPPSQDPPGFDRRTLHPPLFADITAFFQRTL